jgi:hypothetical protein
MTGTSGRSAFAFGKSSGPLIPGMLMSDKIRINDAPAASLSRQGREEWALPTAPFKLLPPGQNLTVSSMFWMAEALTLGSA